MVLFEIGMQKKLSKRGGHGQLLNIILKIIYITAKQYHLQKHRCYTVIELKATKFKPEHTGQLNFYLSAVDDLMRHPLDHPSIGLLLCKSRDKVIAEYALRGMEKPIGVSEYQFTRAIPENLKLNLPTVEEIEAELNELENGNENVNKF